MLVFVEVLHLIFFQPVVIAFMSTLGGDPHLVLQSIEAWCAITLLAVEGDPSPGLL